VRPFIGRTNLYEERKVATIDPTQIQQPSQIPPPGSQFVGLSPSGLVDVYCGTLDGDVDAQPSAQELLTAESDTGTLANADYIYTQLSKLYGGVQLPDFQSPSGNTVKCVVFVSGSGQGGYGAFHIPGTQADFDRIVVDSLNASGNYSSNSGLGTAIAPAAVSLPRLFPLHTGDSTARRALLLRADAPATGRQFLSTALFAAEAVESFETLTGKADPGQTDGEAVSRVLAFKLAPEIALVSGFSGDVAQQWWSDGQPDFVNDNSQTDQSTDGNGAGVMFLLYLTDFLGIPMDQILAAMPATNGAPLGQTYVALLSSHPELAQVATDGPSAFQAMVTLLQQNATNPDGSLSVPADGNPFPAIQGAKQGGLFSPQAASPTS
jgi:hypothetical protein